MLRRLGPLRAARALRIDQRRMGEDIDLPCLHAKALEARVIRLSGKRQPFGKAAARPVNPVPEPMRQRLGEQPVFKFIANFIGQKISPCNGRIGRTGL